MQVVEVESGIPSYEIIRAHGSNIRGNLAVTCIKFSPNGLMLASAGADGCVKVSAASQRPATIATLYRHYFMLSANIMHLPAQRQNIRVSYCIGGCNIVLAWEKGDSPYDCSAQLLHSKRRVGCVQQQP
eukprot:scaffold134309_cov34-Prasinocladus_malaysianus.AAC.2